MSCDTVKIIGVWRESLKKAAALVESQSEGVIVEERCRKGRGQVAERQRLWKYVKTEWRGGRNVELVQNVQVLSRRLPAPAEVVTPPLTDFSIARIALLTAFVNITHITTYHRERDERKKVSLPSLPYPTIPLLSLLFLLSSFNPP
jgi:hypothetical protein